jgi:hypothetical protein
MSGTVIFIICCLLSYCAGWVGSYFVGRLSRRDRIDGIFHVDLSDPFKDIFTIELTIPIDEIPSRENLYLKVENSQNQQRV